MAHPIVASVALLSYGAAALAFCIFALFSLVRGRGQPHGRALALASLLTAVWALVLALQGPGPHALELALAGAVLEVLRNAGWALFLLSLTGFVGTPAQGRDARDRRTLAGIWLFYLVLLLIPLAAVLGPGWLPLQIGFVTGTIGPVMAAVLGLFLVEQLYRRTRAEQRWGIKFACMGIGGLFAYDFYLYSFALLFRHFDGEIWAARGLVNALTVPLIAVSASRNPRWSVDLAVSRHIAFHSASVFGAAVYLLMMASAGYYLRYFGGSWGALVQVVFLFGAAVLLVAVLFSGAFRAWLRVFISKNFYHYNYDYREEWLRFTRTLSEQGPDLRERVVQALAKLVESPGGAIFFIEPAGACQSVVQWNLQLGAETDPANLALYQFLDQKQWVIDLQEYANEPLRYGELSLPAWLRAAPAARLVVPLTLHGTLTGFVVLAQPRSALTLNWEITDLLKIAGMQAASYLAQHEAANALMVARQFESFNRMSTFVVHDLKNLVLQLSLLMSNAQKHKHNPEFQDDMIATIDYSVQKMKWLLHKLSRRDSVEHRVPLELDPLLGELIKVRATMEPRPTLQLEQRGLRVLADHDRLERVIGHLIQNAIEATPRDGSVTVRLEREGERVLLSISDTGHGMSEQFMRERLFKPFETTKSAGMGIGVFESREYIEELGGRLTAVSREAAGSTFKMVLPLHSTVRELSLEESSEPK